MQYNELHFKCFRENICVKTYIAEMNLFYFSSHATPFLFTISGRVSHTSHSRSVKAGRQSRMKTFLQSTMTSFAITNTNACIITGHSFRKYFQLRFALP